MTPTPLLWYAQAPKNDFGIIAMKPKAFHRACKHCGTEFDTNDKRKIYCTRACHVAANNAARPTTQHIDRPCIVCGTMFKPMQKRGYGRRWCSDACLKAYRSAKAVEKHEKVSEELREKREKLAAYKKEWVEKRVGKRANVLRSNYGLTLDDYNRMLAEQNGVCAICKQPERATIKGGGLRPLAVDHCHKTGKVRGLLCMHCNQALGKFNDNPGILASAISYLLKHQEPAMM